jgi:hypothetical protein
MANATRLEVEGLIAREPAYDAMIPALAYIVRQQLHSLHTTAASLEAIQRIEFKGVGGQGWDVYDLLQERGTSRVRIMLRSHGLPTGALFVVKDGPRLPRSISPRLKSLTLTACEMLLTCVSPRECAASFD